MWFKKQRMRLTCIGMILFNKNFMCLVPYKEEGLKAEGLITKGSILEEVTKYLSSRGNEERYGNDTRPKSDFLKN